MFSRKASTNKQSQSKGFEDRLSFFQHVAEAWTSSQRSSSRTGGCRHVTVIETLSWVTIMFRTFYTNDVRRTQNALFWSGSTECLHHMTFRARTFRRTWCKDHYRYLVYLFLLNSRTTGREALVKKRPTTTRICSAGAEQMLSTSFITSVAIKPLNRRCFD